VVIASRSGAEENTSRLESGVSTIYAGTSCVLGIEDGEVRVYGILGRGQKELLVVDTSDSPQFKLVAEENTAIYEDKTQSRENTGFDTDQLAPRGTLGPKTTYSVDGQSPLGLEAAFGEIKVVSPVEPLASHTFFSSSPSKRRASITSSDTTVTPIASAMSSPLFNIGSPMSPDLGRDSPSPVFCLRQPPSPNSVNSGRSPLEPSPASQEQLEKRLHIARVFNRHTEPLSAGTPDMANSLKVSTGWGCSTSAFTNNQFIIIPPSPALENSTKHVSNSVNFPNRKAFSNLRRESLCPAKPRGRRPSQLAITITATPKASQPPTLKAPQLPRSRNPSLMRPVQRQPKFANAISVETARAGVVVPIGAVQIRAARNPTVGLHRGGMPTRRARSVSPPRTAAMAVWAEDKSLWREKSLAID
jgi:hypothetical protein